jgi:hypothetical protein
MKRNLLKRALSIYAEHGYMSKIISTGEHVSILEENYKGLKIPVYKLRKWFSDEQQVFFDCDAVDKEACLREVMTKPNLSAFIIYLLTKDISTGNYSFMDANFRNLGKETLDHFINRYHQQLETMTKLSLQTASREYVACLGHSYKV